MQSPKTLATLFNMLAEPFRATPNYKPNKFNGSSAPRPAILVLRN